MFNGPKLGGSLKTTSTRFLQETVPAPGKLFDARRDFEAKADGKSGMMSIPNSNGEMI